MKYVEEEELIKALFLAAKNIRALFINGLRGFDIGFEQAGILSVLQRNESLSVNEVASIFDKDKATISRAMKALENKRLIERVQESGGDKRMVHVRITDMGREKFSLIDGIIKEMCDRKIENKISQDEQKEFLRILDKILEAIHE